MKNVIKIYLLLLAVVLSCGKDPVEPQPEVLSVPQDVVLTSNTGTSLSFSWQKVEGAQQYAARLEYTDGKLVQQKNPESNSVTFNDLKAGESYRFKVRSVVGNTSSAYSHPLTVVAGENQGGYSGRS